MYKTIQVIILSAVLSVCFPALAQTPTDTFADCMINSLNGKERKNLAKWIFLSMAAHPSIKPFLNATANDIQESDQYIGQLITRLLADDCPNELKAAYQSDPKAVENAFELVGKIAMQELMTNKETMNALTNYFIYADQEKISNILRE
jgi:hypothetical protein